MKKRDIVLIVLGLIALLIITGIIRQERHDRPIKQELIALANDDAELQRRLTAINTQGFWTDGRVGITADGYVFCYRIYSSHGTNPSLDSDLVYLPDEKRFVRCRVHYCQGFENVRQPRDKTDLLQMLMKENGYGGM